jgi:hypothetical protein
MLTTKIMKKTSAMMKTEHDALFYAPLPPTFSRLFTSALQILIFIEKDEVYV